VQRKTAELAETEAHSWTGLPSAKPHQRRIIDYCLMEQLLETTGAVAKPDTSSN